MMIAFFKWNREQSSKHVKFLEQLTEKSTDELDDVDTSFEEEFVNEYLVPSRVTVQKGLSFKTVIGNQPMTPGGRYFFEIRVTSGYLIKIGVCKKQVAPEIVSLISLLHAITAAKITCVTGVL